MFEVARTDVLDYRVDVIRRRIRDFSFRVLALRSGISRNPATCRVNQGDWKRRFDPTTLQNGAVVPTQAHISGSQTSFTTQLTDEGPSTTCNESKEDEVICFRTHPGAS